MSKRKELKIKDILHINFEDPIHFKGDNETRIFQDTNASSKLKNILSSEHNYNLKGGMGIGKTTSIIEIVCNSKDVIPTVLLLPLKMNVDQMKKYCEKHKYSFGIVKSLNGDRGNSTKLKRIRDINAFCNDPKVNLILCLYDNIDVLFDAEDFDPSKYCLVIDEAHNIITSYSYRDAAIDKILKVKDSFRKVIKMTGTPEGIFKDSDSSINVLFEKENIVDNFQVHEPLLNLISYSRNGKERLLHHLLHSPIDGVTVILINNKDTIQKFEKTLGRCLNDPDSVAVNQSIFSVSSDKKDSTQFRRIADLGKLDAKVKYFITTSVIAEGVSIENDNIHSIYIFEIDDFWLKRQFISRFRKGVDIIYDLNQYSAYNNVNWMDIRVRRKLDELSTIQFVTHMNSRFRRSRKLKNENENLLKRKILRESNTILDSYGTYRVSNELIDLNLITELNEIMLSDYKKAIEFYKDIGGFNNVSYAEFDELDMGENFDPSVYEFDEKLYDPEIVINDLKYLLTAHLINNKPFLLSNPLFDQNILATDIDLELYSEKIKIYKRESKTFQSLVVEWENYVQHNFPYSLILWISKFKLRNKSTPLNIFLGRLKCLLMLECILSDPSLYRGIVTYELLKFPLLVYKFYDKYKDETNIPGEEAKNFFASIIAGMNLENIEQTFKNVIHGIFELNNSQKRNGKKNRISGEVSPSFMAWTINKLRSSKDYYLLDDTSHYESIKYDKLGLLFLLSEVDSELKNNHNEMVKLNYLHRKLLEKILEKNSDIQFANRNGYPNIKFRDQNIFGSPQDTNSGESIFNLGGEHYDEYTLSEKFHEMLNRP